MSKKDNVVLYNNFSDRGFCVVPDVLDSQMLSSLQEKFSTDALSRVSGDNFGESGAFIVADYRDPLIASLLTWAPTLEILPELGFNDPKLHNSYVSTKPPKSKALPWHSDLFYKYDEPAPAEIFMIYYLGDTGPDNGCLRVVPGSHLWTHEDRHRQMSNADKRSDEVDVPIKAGDLFIGDRRILHATHPNSSDSWRTCLTLAYAPNFSNLPDSIKALIVKNPCLPPKGWQVNPETYGVTTRLKAVTPIYEGNVKPIGIE